MAVQVSYDISIPKTRNRELKGLMLAAKACRCDNLWLITDHEHEEVNQNGKTIQVVPAYDWLVGM